MNFLPHTAEDEKEMLRVLGNKDIKDLYREIPPELLLKKKLKLPEPHSEWSAIKKLKSLADKNITVKDFDCFLGAGAYNHYIPSAVQHILSRSEFYTAYTPYQGEFSQGLLQSIFEFQTMICQLTGMDVANASMYDGASATAEASLMAVAATKRKKILVSKTVHPEYREVLGTYLSGTDIELEEINFKQGLTDYQKGEEQVGKETAAIIIQQPNFFGLLEDLSVAAKIAHDRQALLIVVADPMTLGVIKPPGDYGADITVGEGQPLGIPLSFGGPYLGYMACTNKLLRRMPGRIVGETKDQEGNRGFVLTLQAREQHIRREKAASNICSNQALCALAATVYLSLMGKAGLKEIGAQCLQSSHYAYEKITKLPGFKSPWQGPFFKEFIISIPGQPEDLNEKLLQNNIIGGLVLNRYYPELKNEVLFCVTEMNSREAIDKLVNLLEGWQK